MTLVSENPLLTDLRPNSPVSKLGHGVVVQTSDTSCHLYKFAERRKHRCIIIGDHPRVVGVVIIVQSLVKPCKKIHMVDVRITGVDDISFSVKNRHTLEMDRKGTRILGPFRVRVDSKGFQTPP